MTKTRSPWVAKVPGSLVTGCAASEPEAVSVESTESGVQVGVLSCPPTAHVGGRTAAGTTSDTRPLFEWTHIHGREW